MSNGLFVLVRDEPTLYDYCGTGFFISGLGHFLTAAHIVEKRENSIYLAATRPEDRSWLVSISLSAISLGQDLAGGRVDLLPEKHLVLADRLPNPGDTVYAYGYDKSASRGKKAIVGRCTCEYL